MIRADLHMHTYFSDGKYSPEEVVRRVKQAGVSLFSVTDHDSMEGIERAAEAAKKAGLLFVRGMEISAYSESGKEHVLGYCCNKNADYDRFIKERVEGSYTRAEDSLKKGNAYFGTRLTMEDVEAFHGEKNTPLHTMHVIDAFAKELSRTRAELYRNVFSLGKPAYSGLCRPSPKNAVEVIHAMGGIACLAHPAQISRERAERYAVAEALKEAGLDGIECYHSVHTERETAEFIAYAKENGLLITGGSDFHEEGKERVLGLPAFYPSDALLEALGLS